jgi:hypothetical protein
VAEAHSWPPSRQGSVTLDIGDNVGALVVVAPADLIGRELEVDAVGSGTSRPVHCAVRERLLPGGTVTAAVFDHLRAGQYALRLRDPGVAGDPRILAMPAIAGACVTEIDLT